MKKDASHRVWDYGVVCETKLMSRHARCPDGRTGQTGFEKVTGNIPDTSKWCDFEFYDLVWHCLHGKLTKENKATELGLWLGVPHRVGSNMSHWILPKSSIVVFHTTVQHITREDQAIPNCRDNVTQFLADVQLRQLGVED